MRSFNYMNPLLHMNIYYWWPIYFANVAYNVVKQKSGSESNHNKFFMTNNKAFTTK